MAATRPAQPVGASSPSIQAPSLPSISPGAAAPPLRPDAPTALIWPPTYLPCGLLLLSSRAARSSRPRPALFLALLSPSPHPPSPSSLSPSPPHTERIASCLSFRDLSFSRHSNILCRNRSLAVGLESPASSPLHSRSTSRPFTASFPFLAHLSLRDPSYRGSSSFDD
jgi:hypothetical protein